MRGFHIVAYKGDEKMLDCLTGQPSVGQIVQSAIDNGCEVVHVEPDSGILKALEPIKEVLGLLEENDESKT